MKQSKGMIDKEDNPFNLKSATFESLTYLIKTNYLPDRIKGPERSRLMFIACCNELLRRINEERSWEEMSVEFKGFEAFKGEQLTLF